MKIQKRFLLLFSGFVVCVIVALALISIGFLREAYDTFAQAENRALIAVMADRMLVRAVVGYGGAVIVLALISVPVGLLLFQGITKSYIRVIRDLSEMARSRFAGEQTPVQQQSESGLLEQYLDQLLQDQVKLRDYEKVKSWKEGARLLMHEIKNPLTPLKLSAQTLELDNGLNREAAAEVQRVLTATRDLERILSYFKELINIEFGPKEPVEARGFIEAALADLQLNFGAFAVKQNYIEDLFYASSESTLLRMVFANLVKNGLEADADGFRVRVQEDGGRILVLFISDAARIEHPGQIFKPGYSEKGEQRGYGLFLCKMISDYLDLDLKLEHAGNPVIFTISIKKSDSNLAIEA